MTVNMKPTLLDSLEAAAAQAGLTLVSATQGSDLQGHPTSIFQLGLPSSMTYQYVAVKFGAPVVKGANFAHYQVLVTGR